MTWAGIRLAAPAGHEALDDGGRLVDPLLRHHRLAEAARRLRDERHRGHRAAGEVVARLLVVDVEQLLQAPGRRERRERRLHVDPDVAGVHRHRERLGRRQPGCEPAVDEQSPDVAVGHPADEVLDVDAAVAQRRALLVGLGDLALEGDDAFEAGVEVGRRPWMTLLVVATHSV